MKCVHHWVIPTDAENVTGVCKKCNKKRPFKNFKMIWKNDSIGRRGTPKHLWAD